MISAQVAEEPPLVKVVGENEVVRGVAVSVRLIVPCFIPV
jgi:hypothetical protein